MESHKKLTQTGLKFQSPILIGLKNSIVLFTDYDMPINSYGRKLLWDFFLVEQGGIGGAIAKGAWLKGIERWGHWFI